MKEKQREKLRNEIAKLKIEERCLYFQWKQDSTNETLHEKLARKSHEIDEKVLALIGM